MVINEHCLYYLWKQSKNQIRGASVLKNHDQLEWLLPDGSAGHLINKVQSLNINFSFINQISVWYFLYHGPGGSSGKVLGCGLDGSGSIPGVGGVEIFLHTFVSRLVLGSTQSPIKMSTGEFPWGKGIGLAILPLPSAVAVNMWTLASTSPVGLHGL